MKPEEVKNYYGNGYRFSKATGMSQGSLLNWMSWGYVPIKSQYILEQKTQGKLKANWDDVKQ
jgi:hypothetical protein